MKISIFGLGYVGLPLSLEFGKKFNTIGYDISKNRIDLLNKKTDLNGDVEKKDFLEAKFLKFTNKFNDLMNSDFYIVAVPTPIDKKNKPDLTALKEVTKLIGKILNKGSIVIYEPTVYPGVTEEICIPILEKVSGLKWKIDFNVGYSPERINPGDKNRRIKDIVKVVSGDSKESLKKINNLYKKIINAGTYQAPNIKTAEAAKVIENTQRDLNIALMNELAVIFNLMKINTSDVIRAASTKWNFMKFYPGLVGGHCIGVDPYYLTHLAKKLGYNPRVILSGRKTNDSMGKFLASEVVKMMNKKNMSRIDSKILILGVTFKENCNDIRNSKVYDIYNELIEFGYNVQVHDPIASKKETLDVYGIKLKEWNNIKKIDVIIAAVAHDFYLNKGTLKICKFLHGNSIFIDVKSTFDQSKIKSLGIKYWSL